MGSAEMSKRTHWVLRLVALAIIAAATWLPRGTSSGPTSVSNLSSGEAGVIQASVAVR